MQEQGKMWSKSLLWIVLALILAALVGLLVYLWQQRQINELQTRVDSLQQQLSTQQDSTENLTESNQQATEKFAEFTSTKGEKVRVTAPAANAVVKSPLAITGEVRGSWSFEATFPIELVDSNRKSIAQSYATLQGEWMTTNYVPFSGSIEFNKPAGVSEGILILRKANASDLPEHDDAVEIPVRF